MGSLGEPRRIFIPFGFLGLSLVGCWGFPCFPQHRRGTPYPISAAPGPRPTLGGRPAPLRVAPLTSRRGGGGLARLPAPRRLQDPDRSAPACCSGDPGPGRPLPLPPARPDPKLRPRPGQSPSPLLRGPQGLPRSLCSQGRSLSLCLSLCLAQGVWVSASLSPRPLSARVSFCLCAPDRPTSCSPVSELGTRDPLSAPPALSLRLSLRPSLGPLRLQPCEAQDCSASRSGGA